MMRSTKRSSASSGDAARSVLGPAALRPYSDRLIYAIGDVHGRSDLLAQLLQAIAADAATLDLGRVPVIVLLGDYVDRGPESRAVLDLILELKRSPGVEVIALKGNHEAALLEFVQDWASGPKWALFGGVATLESYGVMGPRMTTDREVWRGVHAAFVEALPPAHLELLQSLPPLAILDDYAFVHAGVDPRRPIAEQDESDLLWIRDPFLNDDTALEKVIVHGHTPETEPFNGRRRIGVDTGAYATGVLTAIRLLGASRVFLQVDDAQVRRAAGMAG